MQKFIVLIFAFALLTNGRAQGLERFEIDEAWLSKIEALAPTKTRIAVSEKKKILVFSAAPGFKHWTIPHNVAMLKILARKSKAFELHIGYDISNFTKKNLSKYDAVILNNSNPAAPERDLFSDLLKENSTLTKVEIAREALAYEKNLINYVSKGGGLMLLHGALVVQNNSLEFSKMTGGSFDYHPKQQKIHVKEVDPKHPMVAAFNGEGLTHVDEVYFFKNAYFDYNFRPLLYVEIASLEGLKKEVDYKVNYVSWIKRHGKGRVFYSSPSHNAHSLKHAELLQFFLDGLQYVVGDLKCDDSPIGKQ